MSCSVYELLHCTGDAQQLLRLLNLLGQLKAWENYQLKWGFFYLKYNKLFSEVVPTSVRMAIIKKTRNNNHWKGCGEKGTLVHCQWERKLLQPLWKTVWRFLKKLKIELPRDLVIPLWLFIQRK